MSYQVLARKWRPQNFQQVIGQPHVLTALENALTQNRVHHAYLFSGTRGVGKTTIARIFAKSLNCEIGVTATPCGQCANCVAIDQGRFVDLLEIDAASRTKVDDTRELLDNVQYKPAQGRYKVYLIDEVHMLSKHSFNALLKTLEEPPEYVKFLLATTDPQKLPITVLSRCLQFHLKAILPEQIEQQLVTILQHEKAPFEQAALAVIAKAADGSMRDALSLTDQALAFGAGHIEYAAVLKMLGTIDNAHLHYLLHFIVSGNSKKVFDKIEEFVHLGADFAALHQELASLCHQIALIQLQPNHNVSEKTTVQLLAERLTPEEVQLFYQIAVQGYKDYAYAPNGKIALEMTVMRLLAFKPANYVEIDESAFQQGQTTATLATPVNNSIAVDVIAATPQAVAHSQESVATPQVVAHSQESAVTPQVVAHSQERVATPQVVAHSQESAVTPQAVIHSQATAENHPASAEATTPVIQADAVSLESSNSRNMLRSHRLKREALKKTEAATDQRDFAKDRSAAPVATLPALNTQPVNPLTSQNQALKSAANAVITTRSITPSMALDKPSNDSTQQQELPPLSSYQDQQAQSEYTDNAYSAEAYENEPQEHQIPFDATKSKPLNKEAFTPEAQTTANIERVKKKISQPSDLDNVHYNVALAASSGSTAVALVQNESIKKEDVDIASYVDDKMTDTWFLAIKAMQLVGLEKLLAKSAVMQQNSNEIILTLQNTQQHLLNNHRVCEDLKAKLAAYYGAHYAITINTGETIGQTPSQLEVVVYQEYLDKAKASIQNDPIVQLFVRDYAAKVYENSVVPL